MGVTIPTLASGPIALIQQISTGGTLDGSAPTNAAETGSTLILGNTAKLFAAATTGGLFDFKETSHCITVTSIEMVLGGQSAYNVYITDGVTDATANDVLIATGTTATSVQISETLNTFLLPGQKIRIKTTGTATGTWRIAVKAARTFSEGGLFI